MTARAFARSDAQGLAVHASTASLADADDKADALVGAVTGRWTVVARSKPGARAFYVLRNRAGEVRRLRGYEVVRLVRAARANGETVVMPGAQWRDEGNARRATGGSV